MGYRLGVDLGTTFVAAARCGESQLEMLTLGDRSVVMPSAVFAGENGDTLAGEAAERRAASSPERVARQFKRRLGDPTPIRLGEASYAATDLLAILLREVLSRVAVTEGEPPAQVVLTHPANWGRFRREVFTEVPRAAGLAEEVLTLTEPEAAALHYATGRRLGTDELLAVYDLGGGTFDATVIATTPTGVQTVGTPEGVERLGGIDFDQALFDHVNYAADGALDELDLSDPKTVLALARVRQDCVLAKESLSVDTETLVPVFLPGRHFDIRITRTEFENLVRAHIESTITALTRTLRSAGVSAEDLHAVLLVGGSSRIPLVAHMVSEELARPTLVDTHPKYAVALGAATPTNQPTARPLTARATKPDGARHSRPARSTLRRTGAAAVLLAGIAALAWTLTSLPSTPPTPAAPALPAVLPPPQHVTLPPHRTWTGPISEPVVDVLNGANLSELDAVTLTPRWTVALPRSDGYLLHRLSVELLCVKTAPAECIPVNRITGTVGPALQLPGHVNTILPDTDGRTVVMLQAGSNTLSVMDIQTRAIRSVPIAPTSKDSGRALIGVGGHHAYFVSNDEAPAPMLTAVDLETMAVTTGSWPQATNRTTRPPDFAFVQVSPDGKTLFGLQPQELLVYDTTTMTLQRTIPQPGELYTTMALPPDGRYLYLLTKDGELRVIETSTGRQVSSGRTRSVPTYGPVDLDRGRRVAVHTAGGYDLFDTSAFAGS
ncbi:MAG: Hsp70 family protein [Pseudonocardia sp.]|nr:Hsp70 family protein [Pseudonocardia sp.]